MQRRKMSENQAYKKFEPMLHKIAWSFHKTTGLDVDDLFSEANVGFLKAFRTYDPAKGELGLRIWVMVNNHLSSYLRAQRSKPLPVYEFLEESIEDPRKDIEAQEDFAEMMSLVSQETRNLIQVIMSSPEEFIQCSARATRGSLTRFLRKSGWSVEKIARCYREVKSVLNV